MELHDADIRSLALLLCKEQGWTYEYHGGGRKPRLYNPDGEWMTLPLTPSSYGSVISALNKAIRLGARLEQESPSRRFRVRTPLAAMPVIESPWTDSEWREKTKCKTCGNDLRYSAFDAVFCSVDCAEAGKPEPVVLSSYGNALMRRLDTAQTVPADARGNGRYTLAEARQLLRDGYQLGHVVNRTGWGAMWLRDLADRLAAS